MHRDLKLGQHLFTPQITTLVRFSSAPDVPYDHITLLDPCLRLAIRERSKPGRTNENLWILHSQKKWAMEQLENPPEHAEPMLQLFKLSSTPLFPVKVQAHRWRYASQYSPMRWKKTDHSQQTASIYPCWRLDFWPNRCRHRVCFLIGASSSRTGHQRPHQPAAAAWYLWIEDLAISLPKTGHLPHQEPLNPLR